MSDYDRPMGQDLAALMGRAALAVFFISSGWTQATGFSNFVGLLASAGLPAPLAWAALVVGAQMGLGAMLLAGWRSRSAAIGLTVFVAAVAWSVHGYGMFPEAQEAARVSLYWNGGIAGGLLAFAAFGPGRWSLDARRKRRSMFSGR